MDASSVADRYQLSPLSTLSIARYSQGPLRFRDANGIASMLAGGIWVEGVSEGGFLRDVAALTHL